MREQVVIGRRFNGPPNSAHGGYACGVVARFVPGTAEVSLRRPPPIEQPMEIRRLNGGSVEASVGDTVIAQGAPTTVEVDVPEPVRPAQAEVAVRSYFGFDKHAFPLCFGCGPARAVGDGLRIFSGPVAGRQLVAAPWTPEPWHLDQEGRVKSELLWAVLDCPSGWAAIYLDPTLSDAGILLARFAVRLIHPVSEGDRCVVTGWPITAEARKLCTGAALLSATGDVRALGRALWIRPA